MNKDFTDFLIIGSGVAGLRAAIELAPHVKVLIVTKDIPTESNTEYAQGGIAVALSDEDEVGIHLEDTLKAGDGLCREEAVKILVEEGPERITELISWGAEFDREGTKLAFTREAAHSKKRILHASGDSTGRELQRVLFGKTQTYPSISKYRFAFTLDLIVRNNECLGAQVLLDGKVISIFAKATIIATGGAGQLYARTTNPEVATGDGIAMAFRAGAVLEDMEFVQFHPTSLFLEGAPHFLLSEAMRGEGALLRNTHRDLFMKNYHPMAELASRDVVSRAIISEMVRTGSTNVYLDLSHLEKDFVRRRFPTINATCLLYGIDITKDLIPVSPAAHYIMGGIKTDMNGATTIKNLYAAGEVACTGVHGANRLASNSLLEGLVFGARAGKAAMECGMPDSLKVESAAGKADFEKSEIQNPESRIEEIRTALRKLMWEKAGIIRCAESLSIAKKEISQWLPFIDKAALLRPEQELKNMLTVANLIIEAAMARQGSLGAHYRSDYPEHGRGWNRHVAWQNEPIF